MNTRNLVIGLVVVIVVIVAAYFALQGGAGAQEIKVGALYNIGGFMGSIDAPAANGVKLAVKQINEAGGINGKKIKLILIDTKSDQTETAAAAKRLVQEGVVAMIGYGDTNFARIAGEIAQANKIPFITSGATHPLLPKWVGNYMFLAAFGDNAQAAAVAEYAVKKLGYKKVVVWVDVEMDFSRAVCTYFVDAFKHYTGDSNSIVYIDTFHTNDKDYSAQIARLKDKMKSEKIDAIYIGATPGNVGLIIKQIRDAGINLPILGEDGFDTPEMVKVAGKAAEGTIFATHVSLDVPPNDRVKKFIEAYQKEYGRKPENAFAALGYDAMMLLAEAIKRAGSTDPTAIKNALEQIKGFPAVTGTISYSPQNHVPQKAVSVLQVKNGKFVTLEQLTPEYMPPAELALNPIP